MLRAGEAGRANVVNDGKEIIIMLKQWLHGSLRR
jgi:hypothetical protein